MLTKRICINSFFIILALIFNFIHAFGQSLPSDSLSLVKLLNKNNPDSLQGNIYYELAKSHYLSDTKSALEWSREGARYFKNIESYAKMTRCMNIEAVCMLILDRPDESIKMHYKILKIREQLNDPDLLAETYINIGNIFYRGHDKEQALQFYLKSKDFAVKKNNIKMLSNIYNNIANYYTDKYFDTKSNINKTLAIKYLKLALEYKKKLKKDNTFESSYATLAQLYFDSNDLESSFKYVKKGEALSLTNNNHEKYAACKILLSRIALEKNNTEEAQKDIDELYTYITNNKVFHILNIFENDLHSLRNQIRKSTSYNPELIDSIISNDYNNLLLSRQKIREELKIKYETEKKELENTNLLLLNKIEQDKAEKNKIISVISIIFVFILMVLMLILIKKNKSIRKSEASIHKQAVLLSEKNTLLKQSETFKAKLFSIVSHDLKSPISTLKSIIEVATEVNFTAQQQAMLMKEIKQELDTTYSLLNDLLFWSKTQMRSNSIHWKSLNLYSITQRCLTTLHTNLKVKNLRVVNNIPTNINIWGDEVRCEFIVRNLLHNAIKYSGMNQNIELEIQENIDHWDLSIRDFGIGISEEQVKNLFSFDYTKKSKKGTLEEQGSGIGLLLCNDFAESLSWSLQAESKINQGSTFHLLIKKNTNELHTTENNMNLKAVNS